MLVEGAPLAIRLRRSRAAKRRAEAPRNFSGLLDAIERGETVTITRGHHAVAEMRPARRRTGAGLRAALQDAAPPDDRFAADIADALALISGEGNAPWASA